MPFYHVDESVKSNPSKSRGVTVGVPTMFTWKETVDRTATHYCAFAEHGAVYGCHRLHFALFTPKLPHPKVKRKHTELMQGDWMSSLKRLSRCADPKGLVKKEKKKKKSERPT